MNGLVLTGGKSRRMGRDKAELVYHEVPHWRFLGDLLEAICDEVFWSCTEKQRACWQLYDRALIDRVQGLGPAGGLATAFEENSGVPWLVVACDFPNLRASDLEHLKLNRNPTFDATAFRNPDDGLPEPLLAIWEPEAQQRLLAAVAQGKTSPRRVLLSGSVALVDAPNPQSLKNRNEWGES